MDRIDLRSVDVTNKPHNPREYEGKEKKTRGVTDKNPSSLS